MKTTRILSASGAALLSTAFLFALAPSAQAAQPTFPDLVYNVTLNVSSLNLNPNAPFSLDFQLNTGSGNVPNTVTLSNFVFTGGSASGTPDFTFGSETGSLANGVILTNAGQGSEFTEAFSSGVTQITFRVDETPNSEVVTSGTPIPDQFNVGIQDSNFSNITTTDPSGANTLLTSVISSNETVASVQTFSGTGADIGVTAVVAAPEPSSAALSLLAAGGLLGLLGLRRYRATQQT